MHSTLITLIFLSLAHFASIELICSSVDRLFSCSGDHLFSCSGDQLICSSGDQLSPLISILFLVSVTLATEYPAPPATCIVLLAWCCNSRAWSWELLFMKMLIMFVIIKVKQRSPNLRWQRDTGGDVLSVPKDLHGIKIRYPLYNLMIQHDISRCLGLDDIHWT